MSTPSMSMFLLTLNLCFGLLIGLLPCRVVFSRSFAIELGSFVSEPFWVFRIGWLAQRQLPLREDLTSVGIR